MAKKCESILCQVGQNFPCLNAKHMRWKFCSQDSEAWCSYKDGNNDTLYWGAAYLDTRIDAYYYKYSEKPEDSQVLAKLC